MQAAKLFAYLGPLLRDPGPEFLECKFSKISKYKDLMLLCPPLFSLLLCSPPACSAKFVKISLKFDEILTDFC